MATINNVQDSLDRVPFNKVDCNFPPTRYTYIYKYGGIAPFASITTHMDPLFDHASCFESQSRRISSSN